MSGLGYHVQWSMSSIDFRRAIEKYIQETSPRSMLLFDGLNDNFTASDAAHLSKKFPKTQIAYRRYFNGDNSWAYMTPTQWVNDSMFFRGTSVIVLADNEPNIAGAVPWLREVAQLGRRQGIRVGLGGFAVGQPHESLIPLFDGLLRDCASYPYHNVLCLHEYFRGTWINNPAFKDPSTWPNRIYESTQLYHLGRFRNFSKRADQLGIRRPNILISEFGPDYVRDIPDHVYGNIGSLHSSLPTWQSWGFGPAEEYAARQHLAAHRAIYRYNPEVIGQCFFCLTDHPADWREWNAQYAPDFVRFCREGFDMPTAPTTPTFKPFPAGLYRLVAPNNLRQRATPSLSGAILNSLPIGAEVQIGAAVSIEAEGYWWQPTFFNGVWGWSAMFGTGLNTGLDPIPPVVEGPNVDIARLQEIADALKTSVDSLQGELLKYL